MTRVNPSAKLLPEHRQQVAVLIDGPGMNRMCGHLDLRLDYRRFRSIFADNETLTSIRYYAITPPEREEFSQRPLLDWLTYNGYRVYEKLGSTVALTNGQRYLTGRVGVEMTIDAIEIASTVQRVVIVPGEDDLTALAQYLQRQGIRVVILSTRRMGQTAISNRLRRVADEFLEIAELIPRIELRSG